MIQKKKKTAAKKPSPKTPVRQPLVLMVPEGEATSSITSQPCTILFDGRTGNLAQSLGLAEAMGWKNPEIWNLQPRWLRKWRTFVPVRWQYSNWPDARVGVVIGTGWDGSRILARLKKERPQLFTIQLMRPAAWTRPADYDVVSFPQHDVGGVWKPGPNVIVTAGATNRVTPAMLAREADRWSGRLKGCREPRLAVMIGGSTKRSTMTEKQVKHLLDSTLHWAANNGGSLLVSTSRRTGEELTRFARERLENQPRDAKAVPFHFWSPDDPHHRDNPYFAYLAVAEAVVATADSVSMVSEGASAGKPVYLTAMGSDLKETKFNKRFFALMQKLGYAAKWEGKLTLRKQRQPLNDTASVAGFVQAVWNRTRG
ncbi:MAG TPA: ELM1/GtrOC1 family putative glycosyltransferase [Alphaproteobacteria bacterium]|nr:ELM1/GtrOC1 family putative glycosyltransferase [Alphaproteobacteria bacterium]